MASGYSNVTLTSLDGDLSVVVFLPIGIRPEQHTYYYSTRFEHGSMIGLIRRKVRHDDGTVRTHTLFGTESWRMPHNSNWPESGVGLAAEFGVGDDGAFCNYRCGWSQTDGVTNGVLGYREVPNGDTFLKIGVGELIKGTCPSCDSAEDYRFNSPYQFARTPQWHMTHHGNGAIKLEHEAKLRQHGYRLEKEINLVGNVLTVTTTLTNIGSDHFSTAWYSHCFFNCDNVAVGPGYVADLNVQGTNRDMDMIYDEPGTWSWTTPLSDYATLTPHAHTVDVTLDRALGPGTRIKAEFTDDGSTNGGFTIEACHSSITSSIPQVEQDATGIEMYAYNLYIERGTLSPEPMILIQLGPNESKTWTQQLVINDASSYSSNRPLMAMVNMQSMATPVATPHGSRTWTLAFAGVATIAVLALFLTRKRPSWSQGQLCRREYERIPDHEQGKNVTARHNRCKADNDVHISPYSMSV